jgi:hypothetical protein
VAAEIFDNKPTAASAKTPAQIVFFIRSISPTLRWMRGDTRQFRLKSERNADKM